MPRRSYSWLNFNLSVWLPWIQHKIICVCNKSFSNLQCSYPAWLLYFLRALRKGLWADVFWSSVVYAKLIWNSKRQWRAPGRLWILFMFWVAALLMQPDHVQLAILKSTDLETSLKVGFGWCFIESRFRNKTQPLLLVLLLSSPQDICMIFQSLITISTLIAYLSDVYFCFSPHMWYARKIIHSVGSFFFFFQSKIAYFLFKNKWQQSG